MLEVAGGVAGRTCDGLSRRSLLKIGGLGLAGLPLGLGRLSASEAGTLADYDNGLSIVLLFLAGGPSQHETFDPKPGGPGTSTSLAGHIGTSVPGVRFASYFPKLAERADSLSVVRSFQTNHAEHNGAHKQLLTADLTVPDGKPITEPSVGAMCGRVLGPVDSRSGMLSHVLIPPTTRHIKSAGGFAGAYDSVVEGSGPAWLGSSYEPFETQVPMAEGQPKRRTKKNVPVPPHPLIDDLAPRTKPARLDGRLGLLKQLDTLNRRLDRTDHFERADGLVDRAAELIRSGTVRDALDLSQEDANTLAAYDTEHFRNYRADEKSKFIRSGPSIGISLGRQLLLARRLVERGCRFVTLIHANWDFHARKNIPNMPEGMSVLAPPLDFAVSAFLDDLQQRGLSRRVLFVMTGEFGRTPSLDQNLGRHHWPRLCPLVFSGGPFDHGRVLGESDRRGGEPQTDAFQIADLHSTILESMFDLGSLRLDTTLPREIMNRATSGRSILS